MLNRFSIGVVEVSSIKNTNKIVLNRFSVGVVLTGSGNTLNRTLFNRFSIGVEEATPDDIQISRHRLF